MGTAPPGPAFSFPQTLRDGRRLKFARPDVALDSTPETYSFGGAFTPRAGILGTAHFLTVAAALTIMKNLCINRLTVANKGEGHG